jgi:hypothetical protein
MKHCRILLITVGLFIASAASSVQAQIDSDPPLLAGQKSYHLFTVPGVINNGMATLFSCGNASSESAVVGVEVFGSTGSSLNNPASSAVAVAPSGTVMFATRGTAGFSIDVNLGLGVSFKNTARILATTRKGIVCSAFLADPTVYPATSMASLSVVAKTKQKGD